MSSSLHIPGIPYVGSHNGLSRLARADTFATLPRGPVKFRQNIRHRELPPSPPKLARFLAPGAPRRRAFRDTPKRAVPFPALSKPVTPPPVSPPRLCVWTTPSMSKNGVSRSLQKRFFDPATPPRSRIPVRVPLRSCLAPASSRSDAPRPRKKVTIAEHLNTSCTPVLPSPSPLPSRLTFSWRKPVAPVAPVLPSRLPLLSRITSALHSRLPFLSRLSFSWRKPPVAPAPPAFALPSAASRRVDHPIASSLRSSLVRSRSDKVRAKKSVRFGKVTVSEVDFWVDRKKHVFQDGGLWKLGRLQGWRVTPLETPDEDGETDKYMTMWGSDHSSLYYHTPGPDWKPDCSHDGCVWGEIAQFRRWLHKRFNRACDPERLLDCWSEWRRARDDMLSH